MKISTTNFNQKSRLAVLLAASALATQSLAADSTWTGGTGSNWSDAGNWDNGVPGNTSGTAGTAIDLAFFTGLNANNTIAVDANRNIHSIHFGTIALPD